ncbi:MAG TPA: CHAT domain-containing protein [Roseiarcus sp.]
MDGAPAGKPAQPGARVGDASASSTGDESAGQTEPTARGKTERPTKVTVACGHLAFARYPVLVGHYRGDTFAGTEAMLDRVLAKRLTERRSMSLYPGPISTSTVVLDSSARPPGAVVVGLGEAADLAAGPLRRTLRHGVLAFAAAQLDLTRSKTEMSEDDSLLRLSTLLIGAGEGGLDRQKCTQSLLQAVNEAHAVLTKLKLKLRLDELEIVELYEDRAYATWRAIEAALKIDGTLNSSFELNDKLRRPVGSRRSGPVGRDPTWWQPIQITMSDDPSGDPNLSFTIGGGLARAEAQTVAANLELVAPLVRRASRTTVDDSTRNSPGRALFELLWPASLKDQSADERPRRLTLDERSAAFPWELLDDRRPWLSDAEAEKTPPAVRAGLVRQLLQTQFREDIVPPRGKPRALVIGDPRAAPMEGFMELKGAQAEARAVVERLKDIYDVTSLIAEDAEPDDICRQLFTEAWDIIHISAHGVLNQNVVGLDGTRRKRTGVVVGGGVVLTPLALAKLPVSPGIAFVNCCYLGSMDLDGRPEFAANVAVEFMKLGARCVIAAGWAVKDDVAKLFGDTFYQAMLEGDNFGNATLRARRAAYGVDAPDFVGEVARSNTWGAYQCYGDPDYRLPTVEASIRSEQPNFVAVMEAVEAAQRVRDEANIWLSRDSKLEVRLIEIEKLAASWLQSGSAELRVALAEAWGELGNFDKAIAYYEAAVRGEDASFKLKAVEQLANFRARKAVASLRSAAPNARDHTAAIKDIEFQLGFIEAVNHTLGDSSERLSLQGGCWKRAAQIHALAQAEAQAGSAAEADASAAVGEALMKMAERYGAAACTNGKDRPYPRLMACNARVCEAVRKGTNGDEALRQELAAMAKVDLPPDPEFWDLIGLADLKMSGTILLAHDPLAAAAEIVGAYLRAYRHIGSPVKLGSVFEQLDFYQDIFSAGSLETKPRRASIVALARNLRDNLRAAVSGQSSG